VLAGVHGAYLEKGGLSPSGRLHALSGFIGRFVNGVRDKPY